MVWRHRLYFRDDVTPSSQWSRGRGSKISQAQSGKPNALTADWKSSPNHTTPIGVPSQWLSKTSACCDMSEMFGKFPQFWPTTVHDVITLNSYDPGELEGKQSIYTNHFPARGRPFIHPTLIIEDVVSTERMWECDTLGTYVLQHNTITYLWLSLTH